MKNLTAIILAAGKAPRFKKDRKALLSFDGLPLISRTLVQLSKRNIPIRIMTHEARLYEKAGVNAIFIKPAKHRWQTETMLQSRKFWGKDQTLILNADVYYSDLCMDLLVAGKTMFYCGEAEIWGISIDARWYRRAERIAKAVIKYHNKHPHVDENLWRFYRLWYKQPYIGSVVKTPGLAFQKAGNTMMVFDKTVDFDYPREYARWQKGLRGRQVKAPHRPPMCSGCTVVEFVRGTDRWRCPITGKVLKGFTRCTSKACSAYVGQFLPSKPSK